MTDIDNGGSEHISTDDGNRSQDANDNGDNRRGASQHGRCHRCLTSLGCRCLADMPDRWPRTCGICIGVIVPVWFLILLSLFFGRFLADLEAPIEIETNDEIFAARARLGFTSYFNDRLTYLLPVICLQHYVNNNGNATIAVINVDVLEQKFEEIIRNNDRKDPEPVDSFSLIVDRDYKDLVDWMRECGEIADNVTKQIFGSDEDMREVTLTATSTITFNWVSCGSEPIEEPFSVKSFIIPGQNHSFYLPEEQEEFAQNAWNADRSQLHDQIYDENIDAGMSEFDAQLDALNRSSHEASGFKGCNVNEVGGAWFWFTVMTTIGYGNTAPETTGGRTMVFTLGFISILAFAGLLNNAGNIVTAICDDWIDRTHFKNFRPAWFGSIFWGILYYCWMLVIAWWTRKWKESRLGVPFEFSDSYWFSYISTTTVGLGDIYLEHAQLSSSDILNFALLFLFGFVLLANFLVKLSETISNLLPRNRPTFAQKLAATRLGLGSDDQKEEEMSGESAKPHSIEMEEPDEEWVDATSDVSAENKIVPK